MRNTKGKLKASQSSPLTSVRIGVLMGGQSAEREVSLRTGQAVHQALLRRGYDAVAIDVDRSVVDQLRNHKVEMAFVALHGPGGEDGSMQGLLETLGIPYTGSGVRASAIAMHKAMTKTLLSASDIPVPRGIVVHAHSKHPKAIPAGLRLPVVVKPAAQGSTIGITIVRASSEWAVALRRAHKHDEEAVVEPYIPGREVTVSVLSGDVLPAVEIVAPGGFYDYAAKYQKGQTQYLCPAPLSASVTRQLKDVALQTYRIIGCEGAARVDFRITPHGKPFVLEINTTPGMTETSLLPMAAAKAGLDYDTLTERILESAITRAATLKRMAT
ncbi:MAG: D-alanine--D-alanine ligase [Nitrospirales bacterium]|nr:D-alanine--D-alanine ligase [Nitrospirales bacterium]